MTTTTASGRQVEEHLRDEAWPEFVRASDLQKRWRISADAAYQILHVAGAISLGPKMLRLPRQRLIAWLREQQGG